MTAVVRAVDIGYGKARQFAQVLASKVGSGVDIQNIVLAGGGAEFFREVIAEKFPRHAIQTTDSPVFANVRGFQLAGAQFAKMEAFAQTRSVA